MKRMLSAVLTTLLLCAALTSCEKAVNDEKSKPSNSENDIVYSESSQTVISDTSEPQSGANSEEFFESSVDTSFVNSVEESSIAEEESSEAQVDASNEDSSGEESSEEETSENEPTIRRSSLTPVLELDIGLEEGDYELAIEYAFYNPKAPSEFFVRGNEILIYDYANRRLVLYRDGEFADSVKVEEALLNGQYVNDELLSAICAFDEKYYYLLRTQYPLDLFVIDRNTKEITCVSPDIRIPYTGSYEFDFLVSDSAIYIDHLDGHSGKAFRVDGVTVTEVESPIGCTLNSGKSKFQLLLGGEKIPLQHSPGRDNFVRLEHKINGDQYLVSDSYYAKLLKTNGYGAYFKTFYRYDALGNLTGRYLWKQNYTAMTHGYTVGEDGELYVVMFDINLRDPSKGKLSINMVDFGFDDPFEEGKDYEPDVPTTELPPPENPSKLTPVIELGAGDGDYEVGFKYDVHFLSGATEFAIYKNEIAVLDHPNKRVMLYRDGKLVEKIDVSDVFDPKDNPYYPSGNPYCKLNDEYYYIFCGNTLLVIDRNTKEQTVIDLLEGKNEKDFYLFEPILSGANVYLEERDYKRVNGYNVLAKTSYYMLNGAVLSECDKPHCFEIRNDGRKNYIVADGSEVELEYSPEWSYNYHQLRAEGVSSDGSYVVSVVIMRYHPEDSDSYKTYRIFYKYNAEGELVGRYAWLTPFFCRLNSYGYAFDENGELYVVIITKNAETDSSDPLGDTIVGFYKVEIGMDNTCYL